MGQPPRMTVLRLSLAVARAGVWVPATRTKWLFVTALDDDAAAPEISFQGPGSAGIPVTYNTTLGNFGDPIEGFYLTHAVGGGFLEIIASEEPITIRLGGSTSGKSDLLTSGSLATAVVVGVAATLIPAVARPGRKLLSIQVPDTVAAGDGICLGGPAVTALTGTRVLPGQREILDVSDGFARWGIRFGANDVTCRVEEMI